MCYVMSQDPRNASGAELHQIALHDSHASFRRERARPATSVLAKGSGFLDWHL